MSNFWKSNLKTVTTSWSFIIRHIIVFPFDSPEFKTLILLFALAFLSFQNHFPWLSVSLYSSVTYLPFPCIYRRSCIFSMATFDAWCYCCPFPFSVWFISIDFDLFKVMTYFFLIFLFILLQSTWIYVYLASSLFYLYFRVDR